MIKAELTNEETLKVFETGDEKSLPLLNRWTVSVNRNNIERVLRTYKGENKKTMELNFYGLLDSCRESR